jgi:hypothetical protein
MSVELLNILLCSYKLFVNYETSLQAIAVTAVLSSMAFHWQKDEQRPKLFAILNMLGVMTKRGVDYPQYWASFTIKTRCACNTPPNVETDETRNNCPPNDPCNPGPLPIN